MRYMKMKFAVMVLSGVFSIMLSTQNVSADSILKVSRATCERLQSEQGLNADYVGGVDARGNAVAGADLNNHNFKINVPDTISFDLDMNVFTSIGRTDLASLFPESKVSLGEIKYNINSGRLQYNGQDIDYTQKEAITVACQDYFRENSN